MSILGVESVIFGVDDLETCTRFWEDFGLTLAHRDADESVLELPVGSKVVVRLRNDPRLPAESFDGVGVKETIWGVDTPENLERLVAGLAVDREVRRDPDGTAHTVADDGQP